MRVTRPASPRAILRQINQERSLAHGLAKLTPDRFSGRSGRVTRWVISTFRVERGAGLHLDPIYGVSIPELDQFLGERFEDIQGNPPIFRRAVIGIADVRRHPMSSLSVSVSDDGSEDEAHSKWEWLWGEFAIPFFEGLSFPHQWFGQVDRCLSEGDYGSISMSFAARVCVALTAARSGPPAAIRALDQLDRATHGWSDLDQARWLAENINEDPSVLRSLSAAIAVTQPH